MTRATAISQLRERGWRVEEQPGQAFRLPPALASRYPRLPASLVEFLSGLTRCADASETTWFLCQKDYEGTSGSAFAWDEWEQMSLSAAGGDAKFNAEIRAFWDTHFPFLLSVHSGYAFHAVCTAKDRFGQVVEGCEPEFEETSAIAGSFEDFLSTFLNAKGNS